MRILSLPIALLACASAEAGVVNYDEAVSGDLSYPIGPRLEFGVGTNTINGSISFYQSGATTEGDSGDAVEFTIPPGTKVASIVMSIDDIQLDNVMDMEVSATFYCYFCNWQTTTVLDLLNDPPVGPLQLYAGDGDIPAANDFYVFVFGPSFWGGYNYSASWQYELSIEVSAVPLPGAVWLFATAVMLLPWFNSGTRLRYRRAD